MNLCVEVLLIEDNDADAREVAEMLNALPDALPPVQRGVDRLGNLRGQDLRTFGAEVDVRL